MLIVRHGPFRWRANGLYFGLFDSGSINANYWHTHRFASCAKGMYVRLLPDRLTYDKQLAWPRFLANSPARIPFVMEIGYIVLVCAPPGLSVP